MTILSFRIGEDLGQAKEAAQALRLQTVSTLHMCIITERKGEEADSKQPMMAKSLNDSYALENKKNSSHDAKMTQPEEAEKSRGAWVRWRVWVAAAVAVMVVAGVGAGVAIASAPSILHRECFVCWFCCCCT